MSKLSDPGVLTPLPRSGVGRVVRDASELQLGECFVGGKHRLAISANRCSKNRLPELAGSKIWRIDANQVKMMANLHIICSWFSTTTNLDLTLCGPLPFWSSKQTRTGNFFDSTVSTHMNCCIERMNFALSILD